MAALPLVKASVVSLNVFDLVRCLPVTVVYDSVTSRSERLPNVRPLVNDVEFAEIPRGEELMTVAVPFAAEMASDPLSLSVTVAVGPLADGPARVHDEAADAG
jgi:hypothetical protein